MFFTEKATKRDVDYLAKELSLMNDKYWSLWNKHERLMKHLGLVEYEKSGFEIRAKGGPEQP